MRASVRSAAIVFGLLIAIISALLFFYFTNGFYGTSAESLAEALNPKTLAQSDDIYLCNQLNGLGSDDNMNMLSLVLLAPLLIVRVGRLRKTPGWGETALLFLLSLPAFALFQTARCADIVLTVVVGHNVLLVSGLAAWFATLIFYVVPSGARSTP